MKLDEFCGLTLIQLNGVEKWLSQNKRAEAGVEPEGESIKGADANMIVLEEQIKKLRAEGRTGPIPMSELLGIGKAKEVRSG